MIIRNKPGDGTLSSNLIVIGSDIYVEVDERCEDGNCEVS